MKPMLSMSLIYPKMINGEMVSYEEKFLNLAKKQKSKISGLEEIEDQLDAIDAIEMDDQVKMLMEMVDSFHVQKKAFEEMIELYKEQNIAELFDMMSDYEEVSNVQTDLLDDRNTAWIPKIEDQIAKEPTFIAVGAAHLFGEKGVIQLLKDAGYTLKPLEQ